jgi:fumarate hydratase class II
MLHANPEGLSNSKAVVAATAVRTPVNLLQGLTILIMIDSFRTERDTMGDMQIPVSALYGPETARAVQNFPISGKRFPRSFIRALGIVKSAAAKMNGRMGHLPAALAESIEAAAEQVVEGRYDNEFPIDIFQTGSGTSTNMNANEVIGHLAGAHPTIT